MSYSKELASYIVKENASVDALVESLREYGLLSLLPEILAHVKYIKEEQIRESTVEIESPFALNEEAVKKIKRILGNDLAPHEVTINKELLAGFRAKYKGSLYDGSAERIISQLLTR